MSRADFVLYRRMRGVFWGLLTIGVVGLPVALLLAMTIPAQLDMYERSTIESIGSVGTVAAGGFGLASVVALIAAVILGATAGSVDLQRGVLRDLVLTGRSRARIVLGRLVAAMLWLAVAVVVSATSIVLLASILAPIAADLDWEQLGRDGGRYLPALAYTPPLAAGLALLIGSRGPAIAVYFVFALVIDNVLVAIPKVGEWWQHVSLSDADRQLVGWIREGAAAGGFDDRPVWVAALIAAGWSIGALMLGLVRLSRRDL